MTAESAGLMRSEWVERTIGEIAEVVGGGTPSTKDPSNFDGDIPWLTPKDLSRNHPRYVSRGSRNLSRKGLETSSARLLPANSVLLTSRAPIGYVAIAANPIATNQGFRSLILKEEYDHEFVYYWLKAHKDELERHASGSTFKELSGSALKQIRIRLPRDKSEQHAIAHILGTLDDKIELDRRMNETLEAMARALFKSWFVDFDPVVVNAIKAGNPIPEKFAKRAAHYRQNPDALRFPEHILRLFPDRFVDSELGPIPEGWEVVSVGEMADILSGKRPKQRSKVYSEENPIPLWGGNGPMAFVSEPLFNEPIILTGRVGTLGAVFRIVKPSWPSDNTLVIRPHDSKYYDYLYFSILTLNLISLNRGSTQPLLAQSDLKSQRAIRPPMGALSAFADQAGGIFSESQQLEEESHILAILRDTLLPKLVSGELQPLDVEKVLEGLK